MDLHKEFPYVEDPKMQACSPGPFRIDLSHDTPCRSPVRSEQPLNRNKMEIESMDIIIRRALVECESLTHL